MWIIIQVQGKLSQLKLDKKSYVDEVELSSSVPNCEETQAKHHLRFVSMNFRALVHCSSELNCILKEK